MQPELLREEEWAAVRTMLVPVLLTRIGNAYDGVIVLFKGPEVGTRYPDPELRPFVDLDLLVVDPERAHDALLESGFEELDDPPWAASRRFPEDAFADKHHTRPLHSPGIPLKISSFIAGRVGHVG